MAEVDLSWRLRDGFSRLLEESELQLSLEQGPARLDWNASPWQLARRGEPLELHFGLAHPLRGRGPGRLRWRIAPSLGVRARLLWPGDAYLGNFRVPAETLAVEWRVAAEATASASASVSGWLAGVEKGNRVTFTWVTVGAFRDPVREVLAASWDAFIDPFDPATVATASDRLAVRVGWQGKATLQTSVGWELVTGWGVRGSAPPAGWVAEGGMDVNARARLELRRSGRFALLLSRRRGRLRLSVQREGEQGVEAGLRVSGVARGRARPRLRAPLDPLLDPLRRELRSVLRRQIGVTLALEAGRSRRRRELLRAAWADTEQAAFARQYREVLAGRTDSEGTTGDGFELTSELDVVQQRHFSLEVNFFDWLRFSDQRRSARTFSVRRTGGIVTIERRYEVERLRRWRGQEELMDLLASHAEGRQPPLVWGASWSGRLSRDRLRRLLRPALHLGILDELRLPGTRVELPPGEVLWRTSFSPAGVRAILEQERSRLQRHLSRALELAAPGRYRAGSHLRDWIDVREVRETIDRDPAQAHLASRYPVAGRTHPERVQAVAAWRRARAFLDLMDEWRRRDLDAVFGRLDRLLRIPTFLFFHLACPERHRRSGLIVTGTSPGRWGDTEILATLAGRPASGKNETL